MVVRGSGWAAMGLEEAPAQLDGDVCLAGENGFRPGLLTLVEQWDPSAQVRRPR